jgi:ketosteroid isomerase-like protein
MTTTARADRQSNAARVEQALAFMHRNPGASPGDVAAVRELHAEHAVVHARGTSPLGGDIVGRDAVHARMRLLRELSDGSYRAVDTRVGGHGDFVTLVRRVVATRRGRHLDQVIAELWRFEGGQCVEVWLDFEDEAAWDAFWRAAAGDA